MTPEDPDWTIQIPGTEAHFLPDLQQELLQEVENALVSFGRARREDAPSLQAKVTPAVLALAESGLSAREIADNSRLRPLFVQMIVDR